MTADISPELSVFSREFHKKQKHTYFSYLLETSLDGRFDVPSIPKFVDEVAEANHRFGNTKFDKKEFDSTLKYRLKHDRYPPIKNGKINPSMHVLKNTCNKSWTFWFLSRSGKDTLPSEEVSDVDRLAHA